ncbi:putative acetyltransferase [Breznakia sp. PF5-3]|uniref:GNAT family N-acetyltransferase n=1 Tax=unclassified Breznakia TaxID=2623764 RepID=UPI002404A816|nr:MULTISPECIES: GNAT family N-acetyltransferase [unclassified Breznakia]MDF9825220.1 putative acetyltransferase [Breznakia sp. PM6-1]MDF9836101.1 putative acetyltransferase [Breznakia sp. PF5-3]MDF9838741.1 putative acetyltransferase [Breznakia sp. PFB2-8]MDF9860771.1 putative acetyltransferase [Breznakia sp. PH5-24]
MIEYGVEKDKDAILDLCVATHPAKEKEFLTYYFHNLYNEGKSLLIREDDKIISCMQLKEHVLQFHDKVLLCSYLFGISTHIDYRLRGFMDELMHYALDICNQNYLITFIEAYNPKLYKKYGFETVSYRKKFSIAIQDIKVNNLEGVTSNIDIKAMTRLYKEFATRFDCYYLRDEAYYKKYVETIQQNGGNVAMYRNHQGEVQGYCVYYEKDDLVEVKEIIYLDSITLMKLLKYAIKFMPYISLEVSNNEKIEKVFKKAVPRTSSCVMARINHYPLFEKLYDTKIKNVQDAFQVLKRPVLINEKN